MVVNKLDVVNSYMGMCQDIYTHTETCYSSIIVTDSRSEGV